MGETPTRKMIGSRTFLFTILAVSCHGLPKTTEDVVPESMMLAFQFSKLSPQAFIEATTSSGGTEADCSSFATKAMDDIKATVQAQQALVNDVSTGSECAAEGQDAVTTNTAALTTAQTSLKTAQAYVVTQQAAEHVACTAEVDLGSVSLDALEAAGTCFDYTTAASYATIKTACTDAKADVVAAEQAVEAAKTKAADAETALAGVTTEASTLERDCLCRARTSQATSSAALSTAIAAHAADWKQAHEVKCAVEKSTSCQVPPCPTVVPPTLAAGVANAQCAVAMNLPRARRGAPGCQDIFTGLGGCDASISAQMVANYWCQRSGGTDAAPGAFSMVTGVQSVCKVSGSGGLTGAPTWNPGYGCSGPCKCMQNIKCKI